MARRIDPVRLEVFHHLFAAAAEEMGVTLMRSAFSPNIKERRDFSCALFDHAGRMIAQAAHVPVHLGSAPLSLEAVREALVLEPGDVAVVNDPYAGGTHLPDLTFVTPVHLGGTKQPDFYCLDRAHHADVGGAWPGSMAPVLDVHGEGLRIPPVKLVRRGVIDSDVLRLFLANMRVPEERRADLLAQQAACRVGERRLAAMAAEHGVREIRARAAELMDWTDTLMRDIVGRLPSGEWSFEDVLETGSDPGREAVFSTIRLRLRTGKKGLELDFRATDAQVSGPVNTVRAVVVSAVFYVLRLLLPAGVPTNDGILRCASILTRPGTLIDARYPAPVAAGNVETSQRLVDVIFGALAQVLPDRIPAASSGTMSNLTYGSSAADSREGSFTYYETIAGGAGGGPEGPGEHAVQTHMTNTRNTPIEALEIALPARVLAYDVRRGSGGAGENRGGDGVRKRLRFLADVHAGWVAERQTRGPWGLAGGGAGAPGRAVVRPPDRAVDEPISAKASMHLPAGSELEVWTPGGGGFGGTSAS
jgi:N-methylhydantoinase B